MFYNSISARAGIRQSSTQPEARKSPTVRFNYLPAAHSQPSYAPISISPIAFEKKQSRQAKGVNGGLAGPLLTIHKRQTLVVDGQIRSQVRNRKIFAGKVSSLTQDNNNRKENMLSNRAEQYELPFINPIRAKKRKIFDRSKRQQLSQQSCLKPKIKRPKKIFSDYERPRSRQEKAMENFPSLFNPLDPSRVVSFVNINEVRKCKLVQSQPINANRFSSSSIKIPAIRSSKAIKKSQQRFSNFGDESDQAIDLNPFGSIHKPKSQFRFFDEEGQHSLSTLLIEQKKSNVTLMGLMQSNIDRILEEGKFEKKDNKQLFSQQVDCAPRKIKEYNPLIYDKQRHAKKSRHALLDYDSSAATTLNSQKPGKCFSSTTITFCLLGLGLLILFLQIIF